MRITFEYHIENNGVVVATQFLDTGDASVLAMLTRLKSDPVAQDTAGYSVLSKHPNYPGKTRWEVVLAEVARLQDPNAGPILGV